jgi:hypothetical protein
MPSKRNKLNAILGADKESVRSKVKTEVTQDSPIIFDNLPIKMEKSKSIAQEHRWRRGTIKHLPAH